MMRSDVLKLRCPETFGCPVSNFFVMRLKNGGALLPTRCKILSFYFTPNRFFERFLFGTNKFYKSFTPKRLGKFDSTSMIVVK